MLGGVHATFKKQKSFCPTALKNHAIDAWYTPIPLYKISSTNKSSKKNIKNKTYTILYNQTFHYLYSSFFSFAFSSLYLAKIGDQI